MFQTMYSSSTLASCRSSLCRDSFCDLRRLGKESLPCSSLAQSGSDLDFLSKSSISKVQQWRPRCTQSFKNGVDYVVQASIRGDSHHLPDRGGVNSCSQLGGGCCVKNKNAKKSKRVVISRVGSVVRNLKQDDDIKREGNYSNLLSCEDARSEEVNGDSLAYDGQSSVSAVNADSDPSSHPCLKDRDIKEYADTLNAKDESIKGIYIQDMPVAGRSDNKTSLDSCLDSEDRGWRDAVVQGIGHLNGALQSPPEVGKGDEAPLESDRTTRREMDKKDDFVDDDVVNITRIPVPRQTYIAVSKVELVSSLVTLFPSSKDVSMLLEIFACLESVIHAEHKSVLEELRMDYRLAHSDVADKKPSTSELDSSNVDRQGTHFLEWDPKEWWRRISEKVTGSQKNISEVDGVLGAVDSSNENGRPTSESSDSLVQEVIETQREKATVRFQRHFMRVLRSAQFKGLSVNDLKLTAALNSDYLLTLPIDVDWNSASSADALLFRRGYATERQQGFLFGAKLDYIQSVILSNIFNGLTGPLFIAGRWCIEKWESLEKDEEGRALTERIERWLEEPLQRAANFKATRSSSDDESSDSDVEEGLEIWKAARQAVPRYEAVLSSAGSRGLLLRRILVRMGILPPASPRIPDALYQLDQSTLEPYMRPKMLARVSMRDIWRPASKEVCGNNPWKQIRAAFSVFFSRSTLQEPAYQELVLLYNKSKSEQEDDDGWPSLQLHTYRKIPVPDLKVVFPNKKLSFRLIDTVRLDLASIAGLVAFLVSHKFDDLLSSPSAFILDLIASVSLIIYVTRVTLGYKQTADRYQLLVNKALYEKTLASGFGVVHFLLDASEDQLFKGAILVYTLLLLEGRSQSMSNREIAKLCERYLYNNFKEQVEMPMHEIMGILVRLGLVEEDSTDSCTYVSALPDGKAVAALKQQWLSLISKQSIWSVR
uniref:Uncharacterized protein n=1 Tax=Physcomitrium patens TaxID=3218 RepID=A0A2K1KNV3_PHYPA|nr:hypothetical protein PHYPA_006361 [Physcomitrium patens]